MPILNFFKNYAEKAPLDKFNGQHQHWCRFFKITYIIIYRNNHNFVFLNLEKIDNHTAHRHDSISSADLKSKKHIGYASINFFKFFLSKFEILNFNLRHLDINIAFDI